MAYDNHANLATSTVATAPSPATSGTSLVVHAGDGSLFPTPPFNCTVWPAGVQPLSTNAEIVRVTGISTDTLTIVRSQESTSARSIIAGDQIANSISVKILTDIETNKVEKAGDTMTGNLNFTSNAHPTAATVQTKQGYATFAPVGANYAYVPANSTINSLNHFAVIGWVQMQPNSNSSGMIFTKGQIGASSFLVFRNASNPSLSYRFWDNSNTEYDMNGSAQVYDGNWHQVLMMYDGSTMYGYVDGVLDTSRAFTGTLQTSAYEFGIGEWNVGSPGYFSVGAWQEVQLYNRSLTGTEITNLYNGGAGVIGTVTSGLVVGLHLSSGSGTTDSDYSGNGFDATLVGENWITGHVAATVSIPHVLDPWTSSNGILPNQEGIINIGDAGGTLNLQGTNLTSTFNGNTGITINSLGQVGIATSNPAGTLTLDSLGVQSPLVVTNNGAILFTIGSSGIIQPGVGQSIIINNSTNSQVFSISNSVPHMFGLVLDTWGIDLPGNSGLNGGYITGIYTPGWAEYIPFNDTVLGIGPKGGVNLDLQLNPSQTNNLWQARDTSGNVLANLDASAGLHIPKLYVLTGSNANAGTGTLSAGTVTISTTAVTSSSLIFLTDTGASLTNVGALSVTAKTAGTSFVVGSTNVLDSSTFNWLIVN